MRPETEVTITGGFSHVDQSPTVQTTLSLTLTGYRLTLRWPQ